ncbi:hypothetical protein BDZ85DRAFT_263220 [Elsinoe ampelina]|uniref:DUF7605 domain-containing protein n=1 Tax=Elsinoe ampelina TaxID=302913 RepID=A0A6A6GC82_9PEZI|nr:hypothetical protein BDZ85DRAFT_263220 [Elsinoe ampelina]
MPVSSSQHQLYVDGLAGDDTLLKMGPDGHGEDGVAAIRSLMFMRAQDGLMQRLLDYVFNDIEVPLGRMKLVLEKNPDDRRESLFKAVEEAIENGKECVTGYHKKIQAAAEQKVLKAMTKTNKHWVKQFDELIQGWYDIAYAHQTFKAIARRHGRHYIKKQDATTDWTGDVIGVVTPSIQLMIRDFKQDCERIQVSLLESFNGTMDGVRDTTRTDANVGGIDMTTIFKLLETHKKHFEHSVPAAFAALADSVIKLGAGILPEPHEILPNAKSKSKTKKLRLARGQGRDFYKSMVALYDGLVSDQLFGPGTKKVTAKRWAHLRKQLCNTQSGKPMSSLRADFRFRLTQTITGFAEHLMVDIMGSPFREISADFEARFGRYEDFQDQATRDSIKTALEKVLPQARQMFDEAQRCLNCAVEWEKEHGGLVAKPVAKQVKLKAEDFLDDMVSDVEEEDEDDDEDGGETEDSDSDLESEAD